MIELARSCGIDMMESRLLCENGRSHFMTKRFDRKGPREKVHMQTLCGIAHYDYKMLRAYSYEQAFLVMRLLRLPYVQSEQMFRRMAFNVIAMNQDDHTKNISFLMDKAGKWSLSPAYDMSWAYNPAGVWTSMHQMSINGKWSGITRQDLIDVAHNVNIRRPEQIIDHVCDGVSQWAAKAKEFGIPEETIKHIDNTLLYRQF